MITSLLHNAHMQSYNPGPTQLSTTLTYNATPSDMNGFHDNKANENEVRLMLSPQNFLLACSFWSGIELEGF